MMDSRSGVVDNASSVTEEHLLHNLLVFVRLLRSFGINASTDQVADLARILALTGIASRENVYYAARALLVGRHQDLSLFDRAFDLFFNIRGHPHQSVLDPTLAPKRAYRPKPIGEMMQERRRDANQSPPPDEQNKRVDTAMVYSPLETLRRKDFEKFTPEELAAARRMIAGMDWRVGERTTRRKQRAPRGPYLDFPHLVRQNLKYDGELFTLPKRAHKIKPRPLVVLADISGSMERSTRMVLHLLHTLAHAMGQVEIFVFATRLTRITPDLRRKSVDEALARVTQHVADWSGGTRIGEALKTFNFKWARRVLRHDAVVLILSDGWDTGDLDLLRDEMARLQRSCSRLIWLSPLPGPTALSPSSEAMTLGLRVALAHVDEFLPVHNLIGLEELAARLSKLGERAPVRRLHPRIEPPVPTVVVLPKFSDLPQMGTSDYVRRTMTLRLVDGVPRVQTEENPDNAA